MKYFFYIFFIFFSGCNKNNKTMSDVYERNVTFEFNDASDRSTAYIENQKIVSKNGHVFLSFLDYIDKKYKVHLVHIHDNKIIESTYLDEVYDNHGGGSISLNRYNRLCTIYGGHVGRLKYRCAKYEYNISEWDEPIYIGGNATDIWQTYPSMHFDENNTLYVTYREENKIPEIRDPMLILLKKYENGKEEKEIVYTTDNYYSNFTATFVKYKKNTDVLFMKYGIFKDKVTKVNRGISLMRKNGNLWNEIKIVKWNEDNLYKNYYPSNLVRYQNNDYFIVIDKKNSINFLKLFIVDDNDNITKVDLLNFEIIQRLISFGYQPNVRVGLSINDKGDLFIVLPFVNQNDYVWSSSTNKVYYLKLDKNFEKITIVSAEDNSTWLVNINKSSENMIPDILYTDMENNKTIFKKFEEIE